MYNDPNSQPPYGQPPQSPYTSPYEQQYVPPTQYGGQPQYVPPQPQYIPPQPQKSSNRTVWIVLGVVLGIILLVGGGCCAALSFGVFKIGQAATNVTQSIEATATADEQTAIADEPSPLQQAEDYYTSIEAQDYSDAYLDIASNVKLSDGTLLTESVFTQKAGELDNSEGQVTNFTAQADSNDATKVTVQVTRSGKTYTVHLTFIQEDGQWLISSFDNI